MRRVILGTTALLLVPPAVVVAAEGSPAALRLTRAVIEAHGGMTAWRNAPTVSFVEAFRSGTEESGQPIRITIEQGRRRAYVDVLGSEARTAWDGERAWSLGWEDPTPPRFHALLNYYFSNLPWLTQDPGVRLAEPGTATIPGDPTEYRTIRMTFDPGTGDTPDDYYLLYIHPETHRLHATEYIVTYEAILPDGAESTPPHLLVFDAHETVDGLMVPTHYTIYENGSIYATCALSEWSFRRPFDEERLRMPEGAVVDTSTP